MKKLVEDITIGEDIVYNNSTITIIGFFKVNGEGVGFVAVDKNNNEVKFSKSCGTFLEVII